jgi:hypothetical protein
MDKALAELNDVLDELDVLFKNADVGAALASSGINISLALTIVDGLRAYVRGDKAKAADDLGTAAEEISSRLRAATKGDPS